MIMVKKEQCDMNRDAIDMTSRELLIRIDERQKILHERLSSIEENVIPESEYSDMKNTLVLLSKKVESLEISRAKLLGWFVGAGAMGGIASGIIETIRMTLIR